MGGEPGAPSSGPRSLGRQGSIGPASSLGRPPLFGSPSQAPGQPAAWLPPAPLSTSPSAQGSPAMRFDDAERRIAVMEKTAAPPPKPSYLSRPSSQLASSSGPATPGEVTPTVGSVGATPKASFNDTKAMDAEAARKSREELLASLLKPRTPVNMAVNYNGGDHEPQQQNSGQFEPPPAYGYHQGSPTVSIGSRPVPIGSRGSQNDLMGMGGPSSAGPGSLPKSLTNRMGAVPFGVASTASGSGSRPGSAARYTHNPYSFQQSKSPDHSGLPAGFVEPPAPTYDDAPTQPMQRPPSTQQAPRVSALMDCFDD